MSPGVHVAVALILFSAAAFVRVDGAPPLVRVTLPQSNGARCLDGSPAVVYVSLNSSSSSWVFYLQGGGWCSSIESCWKRKKTRLGSSREYPPSYNVAPDASGLGFLGRDPVINPFPTWNQVFVPYCSGDLHSGTRDHADLLGFHFAGRLNFQAAVSFLKESSPIDTATEAVLTGGSAGGFGTLVNVDVLAELLPGVRVGGIPDAGWLIASKSCTGGSGQPYAKVAKHALSMWQSVPSPRCTKYECLFANVLYPHIKSPLMVVQARFDWVQASILDGCPDSNSSQAEQVMDNYLTGTLGVEIGRQLLSFPDLSYFYPSCKTHGIIVAANINGTSMRDAVLQWWSNGTRVRLEDQCQTIGCNPSC